MLDTNVLVDFLNMRQPRFGAARKLMILGAVGENELWISSSQVTDLVYILTQGGKPALRESVAERLRGISYEEVAL